jgi:hypothetical protein
MKLVQAKYETLIHLLSMIFRSAAFSVAGLAAIPEVASEEPHFTARQFF